MLDLRGTALVCLLVAACGDGGGGDATPAGDTFASGTRLRAVYLDGGEGAVRLVRWHDVDLDAPCVFAYDPAGALRCLPGDSTWIQYADAACAEPVALFDDVVDVPAMALDTELGCPGALRAGTPYAVGGARALATTYLRNEAGDCIAGDPVPDGVTAYDATAADPAAFAAGELVIVARDGDGDTLAIRGADGAYQVVAAADDAGGACGVGSIPDRCVPWAIAYDFGDLFGDAACTTPVAYAVGADACPTPTHGLVFDRSGACTERSVVELGAPVAVGEVYLSAGDACALETRPRGTRYFEVGAAAPDAFLPVTTVELGTGRLRVRHLANAQGAVLGPADAYFWRDTELGFDCAPDGGRCLPDTGFDADFVPGYADAACTQPLWFDPEDVCGVIPDPPWVRAYDAFGTTTAVHQVGEVHAGPIHVRSDEGCAVEPAPPAGTYRVLGPAMSLDVMAPITEVTE